MTLDGWIGLAGLIVGIASCWPRLRTAWRRKFRWRPPNRPGDVLGVYPRRHVMRHVIAIVVGAGEPPKTVYSEGPFRY